MVPTSSWLPIMTEASSASMLSSANGVLEVPSSWQAVINRLAAVTAVNNTKDLKVMVVTAHRSGREMCELELIYHVLIFSSKTVRLLIMCCAVVIREFSAAISLIITLHEPLNLGLIIDTENDQGVIEILYL